MKQTEYFMINEKLLDKQEAIEFIACLNLEHDRHLADSLVCLDKIKFSQTKPIVYLVFWFSSYKRHLKDLEMIDKTIVYLQNKFRE